VRKKEIWFRKKFSIPIKGAFHTAEYPDRPLEEKATGGTWTLNVFRKNKNGIGLPSPVERLGSETCPAKKTTGGEKKKTLKKGALGNQSYLNNQRTANPEGGERAVPPRRRGRVKRRKGILFEKCRLL